MAEALSPDDVALLRNKFCSYYSNWINWNLDFYIKQAKMPDAILAGVSFPKLYQKPRVQLQTSDPAKLFNFTEKRLHKKVKLRSEDSGSSEVDIEYLKEYNSIDSTNEIANVTERIQSFNETNA